jgi:hypothetical protein
MKRQRGRGRKPGGGGGGNHGNRPLESNGPEVKIRGTAAQIYEKYSQYARDAQSGGDRVKYENYLQHAEHYFRVMMATMPRDRILQQQEGGGLGLAPMQQGQGGEGGQSQPVDGNPGPGAEGGAQADPLKVMDDQGGDDDGEYDDDGSEDSDRDRDRDEVEASDQDRDQNNNQNNDRQGRRRRRGRRNRHHDTDRGPDNNGGGNNSALDSLARKQGALAGG